MARIVVSEASRRLQRDESYSATPGPAIPGGLMHGMGRHAATTSCGRAVESGLHVWPALSFPRAYGPHCQECLDATEGVDASDGAGADAADVAGDDPTLPDAVLDLTTHDRALDASAT